MCKRCLVLCVLFLACAELVACGAQSDPRATTYVVLDSAHVDTFLSDLAALSKTHGLTPNVGSATPDRGPTLHVFEARGRFLRLWAQNTLLSPGTCGAQEAQNDPNQFILSVTPELSLPLRDSAKETSTQIAAKLRSRGYFVRSSPAVPCGRALLSGVARE